MTKYSKSLIEHLQSNPHIEQIHFNSKGEWLFMARNTHLDTKTRAQVLAGDVDKAEVETPETIEVKTQSKQNRK